MTTLLYFCINWCCCSLSLLTLGSDTGGVTHFSPHPDIFSLVLKSSFKDMSMIKEKYLSFLFDR